MDEEIKAGVRRWAIKQAIFILIAAIIIFLTAGTLRWWKGWALVITLALTAIAEAALFLPKNPGLLAERSKRGENTFKWDIPITVFAVLVLPVISWIVAGLEHRSGVTAPLPTGITLAGIAVWILSTGLLLWAMHENAYFSGTVRIQEDRGHVLMTGGPYALVRHPGYLGSILFYSVMPMVLNSLWANIPTFLAIGLFILRTALEDRALRENLPGYEEYVQSTKYRLVPFLW